MIILYLVIVLILLCLAACYWYQTQSHVAKLLNQFPLVAPIIPVLGNVDLLSTNQEALFAQIRKFSAMHTETYAAWGGFVPTLHIITPDDAEIILSNMYINDIKKGIIYYSLHPWLGTGLLTSSGEKWSHRRKMLNPTFRYNVLKSYVDIFGEQSVKLINLLKAERYGTPINITPFIKENILIALCETMLGLKIDRIDKNIAEYFKALSDYIIIVMKMAVSPWLHPKLNIYHFFPLYRQQQKLVEKLRKFTQQAIREREEKHKKDKMPSLELDDKSKKKVAMLDLLINAKRQMGKINDEGIQEEVDTFVFEGYETKTYATCFALMLIAKHKEVQRTIIEELDGIFSGSTRQATHEDLRNMRYLERCLKECLRLYPSIPLIVRHLKKDTPLTHHVAPAGAEIFIHIYDIHRDSANFPNPDEFDPDRFLPENSQGRHPFAYIPFSAGLRNCIGQKFAMLELKSILSAILRNFTIEAADSIEDLSLIFDFVLKVKKPIYITFKPRSQAFL